MEIRRPASIAAEFFDVTDSTRLWRVFHETYDLCLVPVAGNDPAGESHWWYRGQDLETRPGGLIITEPGEVHVTKRFVHPARFFWIVQIDPAAVRAAAEELGAASAHLRVGATRAPRLYCALARLHDTIDGEHAAGVLEQQTAFTNALRILIAECGESRPTAVPPCSRKQLEAAREVIHARYAETIRLEELATAAGISRYHLAHEFTREYGVPPHAYQNALRAAEAMRQLRERVPMAMVDVGFADQSHLTRHFKRAYGVTPGRYATAVLRTK